MSVLVEALTLIVPRRVLDAAYPGGAGAYLSAMRAAGSPARMACADGRLTSVAFYSADDAQRMAAPLLDCGLVGVEDGAFRDFAFVDQHDGPTVPCPWLAWQRHPGGYTHAWLADEAPGDLAAPAAWTPAQSRALTRFDIRDVPGRMLRLAAEDDRETWLDFTTGREISGPAARTTPIPTRTEETALTASAAAVPLLDVIVAAVEACGWTYARAADGGDAIVFPIHGDHAAYHALALTNEKRRTATVYCAVGAHIPSERRGAVAEAIARANHGLPVGAFELDCDGGALRCKVGVDVEGGALTVEMARDMIALATFLCDHYHDALMRVAFGAAEPAAAIAEAEAV